MTTPPDQPYYNWLCSQIEIPSTFRKTFNGLYEKLHNTEFFWVIPGDDNRIMDARDMRTEFLRHNMPQDVEFKDFVSVLEILIVVSRDLEWVASGEGPEWAWRLIENLGLNHFFDPFTKAKALAVDEILDKLIWRTYERNGRGGFFPLIFTNKDQTKIEIWYQLNEYVLEIVQR